MSTGMDLAERARRAVEAAGFQPDFPAQAAAEICAGPQPPPGQAADLTGLPWSSIDNEESRDLDQLEYAEAGPDGAIRIMLAIADVATCVAPGSAIDNRARFNTVSIYTAGHTFHLLPPELSTSRTSLLEGETRLAVVIDMLVGRDGEVHGPKLGHATVRNHARITYDEAGAFLEADRPLPQFAGLPILADQLRLQGEAARRLMALRKRMGALTFSSFEARPVYHEGRIVNLQLQRRNAARDLIESFMIAGNVATASYLKGRGFPIIERAVNAPRRWDRICAIAAKYGVKLPDSPAPRALGEFLVQRREADPAGFRDLSLAIVKLMGPGEYVVEPANEQITGHFGLALDDYSHSTAPNRRYADLVIQRMVFAALASRPVPFKLPELRHIAKHCTEREDAARKVERFMRKVAAADLMGRRVGEEFEAIVTGASYKGTYVRLFSPAVEGKVILGEGGMDVGDRVRVRLLSTNPDRGFIDFARA